MKLHTISLLLFITSTSIAQSDPGPGFVFIHFDDKTVLDLYNDTTDHSPAKSIEFFNDPTIYSWNIKNIDQQTEWLKPEALWLEYDLFVFKCARLENNWFRIITNNENGDSYWLRKSDLTEFRDWEHFLKDMFSISRLPDQNQPIKTAPTESSKTIPYDEEDCFQVKSMKGDWIEIFTPDFCDEEYNDHMTKIKSGWIRWKKDNKLLIMYSFTS